MKDWMKWGLAGAVIGFVIEVLTLGYLNFFWLEPKLERVIDSVLRIPIPGEQPILVLSLYFITGAIIGKIISKYWPKRG